MDSAKQGGKLRRFYNEVVVELKKVAWPSRRELYGATMVVLFVVLLLSLGIGVVDAILGQVMQLLIRLGT